MIPTHKRKQLTASCVQWRGDNFDQVAAWCSERGLNVQQHFSQVESATFLIIRGRGILTMPLNFWIIEKENGEIKTYSHDKFSLIYEPLS